MNTDKLIDYLEELFPEYDFYNNTIDRNSDKCIGVYIGNAIPPHIALGGLENTSFNSKSFTILIHWTENAKLCEETSDFIYNGLRDKNNFMVDTVNIRNVHLLDSGPINVSRDSNNICEMVIRLNVTYEI